MKSNRGGQSPNEGAQPLLARFFNKVFARKPGGVIRSSLTSDKKTEPKTRREAIVNILKETCKYSSIHGLRYLAQGGLTSRVVWALPILISFTAVLCVLPRLWLMYASGASEVRLISTRAPLYFNEFPTISLCPPMDFESEIVRAELTKQLNLTEPLSEDENEGLASVADTIGSTFYLHWYFLALQSPQAVKTFGNKLDRVNMSVILEKDWLAACMWLGSYFNCCKTFEIQRRMDRWCFVFNGGASERMKLKQGCNFMSRDPRCAMRRSTVSGTGSGLVVVIKGRNTTKYNRLYVGSAYPFTGMYLDAESTLLLERGTTVRMRLSITATTVGEEFSSIPEKYRGCKTITDPTDTKEPYSRVTCAVKAVYRSVLKHCGCVPVTVKIAADTIEGREPVVEDRLCKFAAMKCLNDFMINDTGRQFIRRIQKKCPPACQGITYSHSFMTYPTASVVHKAQYADSIVLDVFFADLARGIVYERRRSISVLDVFLRTSGLLGLLLGCSCSVFFEIVYFSFRLVKVLIFVP